MITTLHGNHFKMLKLMYILLLLVICRPGYQVHHMPKNESKLFTRSQFVPFNSCQFIQCDRGFVCDYSIRLCPFMCIKKLLGKGSSQWEFLAMFWKRSLTRKAFPHHTFHT
uniref:WAP domain-containing protein n=1 Tax=Strigamia maritima TaxID=126957 RepID=T1JH19_STRMM